MMGSHHLSARGEKLLRQYIDELLFYVWDPIGLNDVPEARDEYAGYVDHIFSLLMRDDAEDKIPPALTHFASVSMGLGSGAGNERKVTEQLLAYKAFMQGYT